MIIALVIASLRLIAVDMAEVRYLFTVAEKSEKSCKELLEATEGYTMDYAPLTYAYHAAAEMTMANHVTWPGTKLSHFNKGKKMLEKVIGKYPKKVELRYIRFAVQYGSPSFLGYRDDLDTDRNFVLANLDNADVPKDHKELMKKTVNQK